MSIFQEFFGQMQHVPKILSKNIKTLRELEDSFQNVKETLDLKKKNFMKSNNKNTSYQLPNNIEKERDKCFANCSNKMDIANDCYFLLDNKIKKLTGIIENLEQELISTKFNDFSYQNSLLDKNLDELVNFESYLNNKKKSRSKKNRNAMKNLNLNLNISINSLKKRQTKKILKLSKKSDKKIISTNSTYKKKKENLKYFLQNNNFEDITYKEIDGKIGLREPIYCFCNYVSFGDMVKCDNPKCPREWFHFNCVGLTNLPKGKWYCSSKCSKWAKKGKIEK